MIMGTEILYIPPPYTNTWQWFSETGQSWHMYLGENNLNEDVEMATNNNNNNNKHDTRKRHVWRAT
jgi:hypothetical protein